MKGRIWIVAAALAATQVHAAPPAALEPALKQSIEAVSQDVLRDLADTHIRNRAYSIDLLREQVQARLQAEKQRLQSEQIATNAEGLQERVLEETQNFLNDLGPEVDRLAADSSGADEFAARLRHVSDHVDHWSQANSKDAPRAALVSADPSKAGELKPTEENIEGPFYRPNAPFTSQMAPAGADGQRVTISGAVLNTKGEPIQGAIVDVWQADSKGNYDFADPADRTNPRVPYLFRARIRTDNRGRYAYSTVLPGNYEIGEGKWRCKHIHYKVSAPGLKALTTQLYFEGDPYNAVDPWWKASTTIKLNAAGGGSQDGQWNVVLGPDR